MRGFLIFLLVPALSFAAEIQAGFPSQAIWVSNVAAVEGATLVISTVVFNGSHETLRGSLIFLDDGTRIGARELELPSGESQIHSVEWKGKRGEHKLAARIEGTSASLSQKETPSILVTIAAPPPPSQVQATISQVVQVVAGIASSSTPALTGAAQAIFSRTEALRTAGAERLGKYLASAASTRSSKSGAVAGVSTSSLASNIAGFLPPADEAGGKVKELFSNVALAAAAAALFALGNAFLFYPLLALICFAALLYLVRKVKKPPGY